MREWLYPIHGTNWSVPICWSIFSGLVGHVLVLVMVLDLKIKLIKDRKISLRLSASVRSSMRFKFSHTDHTSD